MSNEEFLKILESHDWYYIFADAFSSADSYERYKKGLKEELYIKSLCKTNKDFNEIYKQKLNEKFSNI